MRVVNLGGLNADQAIKQIESLIGEALPREVKEVITKRANGGTFNDAMMFGDQGTGKEDGVDDYTIEAANEKFTESDEGKAMIKKYGPVPPYNGVVGDSCPCSSCNLRRKALGIDAGKDRDDGLDVGQSKAQVEAGYTARGMKVPDEATRLYREALARVKAKGGIESFAKSMTDMIVHVLGPGARVELVNLLGAKSPLIASYDEVLRLTDLGLDATREDMKRIDDLLEPITKAVEEARRKQAH